MTKPRILVWYWGRRGGGAWYAYEVARSLRDLGTADVVLSTSRQSHLRSAFESLGLPNLTVDTYEGAVQAVTALPRLPAVRAAFETFLKAERIDAVLCPMAHLWNPLMLGVLCRLRIPYVLTVHDGALHPGERSGLRQWWADREVAAADGIVVLSEHVGRVVAQRFPAKAGLIAIGSHGPLATLMGGDQAPARPPTDTPRTLMFFGRIVAYKGLDLLLDAYARLRPRYPDLRLLIAGSGDLGPYRDALAGLERVEIDNRYIAETEIPAIVARADILVLSYVEASQSGVVALAEGAGVPVVATPVGGLTEQVRDGETGVLARAATGEAVAEAIERLLTDPALYRRCANGIVDHSRDRWRLTAERSLGLIGRVLAERGAVSPTGATIGPATRET